MIELTPVMEKFILHWGEMGTRWGINRTVAQVHALLFIAPRPLNAEEITSTLQVARSNVSNSLRELQGWGIVKVVHVMGDRRDHFESMADVWDMFHVIAEERRRREIDPTVALLKECVDEAAKAGKREAHTRERLGDMLEFFDNMVSWQRDLYSLPKPMLKKIVKLGARIRKLI